MADTPEQTPTHVPWRTLARVGAAVVPLATCAILSTVRDSVTAATAVLVLVLWVVAAAATGDRIAGLIAALSAGVWFDYFLTEPYHRFAIARRDDLEITVLLVLIGAIVTELALWGRNQQGKAAQRSGYLDGVLGAARIVSEGDAPTTTVIDVVGSQITHVLEADSCHYVAGPVHDARIALLDHDGVVTRGGRVVDIDRAGLPTDEYVALIVRKGPHVIGHFLVTATSKTTYPSQEQRQVAVLLADQVAAALDAD